MTRVAVVGGGISGLATAYFLRRHRPVLYEARDRLGGVIETERTDGFLIEGGPDALLAAGSGFCEELGVPMVPMRERTTYVLWEGKLRPVREAVSWPGKMRMLLDLVLPRTHDPSLGGFLRRRLGSEFVEKIADPLFGGIYNAPVDRLSLAATMPRLLERRSILRAMTGAGELVAPRDGMGALVEALRVPEVEYRTGTPASLDDIDADRIVLAAPPRSVNVACEIPSTSVTTVSLGFADVTLPPGAGFVSPGRAIKACSWSSQKFEGRAPEGRTLVRCFFRGDGTVERAREELRDILGITAEPILARRHHWPDAGHIYEVGHERRVAELEARLPKRVMLTGAAARGVGIPNLIRDARRIAAELS